MEKQITFEDINILNEKELEKISFELGDGYGGVTADYVFDLLLPQGYSLKFIKELFSSRYLCITIDDILLKQKSFDDLFEEYKQIPIIEYTYEKCQQCKKDCKRICSYYKRTGKYLNEKGDLIKEEIVNI